jgi:hypothetical protein
MNRRLASLIIKMKTNSNTRKKDSVELYGQNRTYDSLEHFFSYKILKF